MSEIFVLVPKSLPDGAFAARWFDDRRGMWKDPRILGDAALASEWEIPPGFVAGPPGRSGTGVLFNPEAFAVDEAIYEGLRHLSGVEFLPISVKGLGQFFLMHPTGVTSPSSDVKVRLAPPPSGNVVEVEGFSAGFEAPSDIFRVRHPPGSAAGRLGYCNRTILVSHRAAEAIRRVAAAWLELEPVRIVGTPAVLH